MNAADVQVDTSAHGWSHLLGETARAVERLGARGWIVGGYLRDALLGVPVGDVDLAVTCDPAALANAVRAALPITIARLRRSVRLGLHAAGDGSACQLDIAPLHGAEITADLARRDFTVNALALPLDSRDELLPLMLGTPIVGSATDLSHLIDPFGGLAHLHARILHLVSDSALRDEPGRLITAARFTPSESLLERARDAVPLLGALSPDRVRDELNALLALPRCVAGLRFLAAVAINQPGLVPFLVHGRPLKALTHCYNKRRAHPQAKLADGGSVSRQLDMLTDKRNRQLTSYPPVASRRIVDWLVAQRIGTLVSGKNDGWKQQVRLGKRTNQHFFFIPHARFIQMLTYKAALVGIQLIVSEESSTSQCSFLDLEPVGK